LAVHTAEGDSIESRETASSKTLNGLRADGCRQSLSLSLRSQQAGARCQARQRSASGREGSECYGLIAPFDFLSCAGILPEHRQELVPGKGTAFGCSLKRIQNFLRQIRWQRFEPRDQIAEPRNPLK
jgi:hypothetical protein